METAQNVNPLQQFMWTPQPEAEKLVAGVVEGFLAKCPAAGGLRDRMRAETGTRFFDWVDSIFLPVKQGWKEKLMAVGFTPDRGRFRAFDGVYSHANGIFPRIGLHEGDSTQVLIKVDSVADFAAVHGIESRGIEGGPLANFRRVRFTEGKQAELWAVERHGHRGYERISDDPQRAILAAKYAEAFRTRRRNFEEDEEGFDHAMELIEPASRQLGVDATCDLFFRAEREFWQRRNRAAQVQKARQDRLGLGWANHDHHTYRSSRKNFSKLIGVMEALGLVCRERYYAGAEAGWGAQIMEQPFAGIVVFADVDLSPQELFNDFSHEAMQPRKELGTVGLWCALHGEAFLQAGMHHLECQFDFEALRQQLESEAGIGVMKPFTDFPYLRQAFTKGERWPVDPKRIERILAAGQITAAQAEEFRKNGAIGSHLENLERNEGFKGFNQKGVSEIIAKTDPRIAG
jgi:hypothetical protein